MSILAERLSHLQEADEAFVEKTMKEIKKQTEEAVAKIKNEDEKTLDQWKERYNSLVDSTLKEAASWVDLMYKRRQQWNEESLDKFAKKIRDKNEATLKRLSTNKKRTPDQITVLKEKFENTVAEQVQEERRRLASEDDDVCAKGSSRLRDRGVFERYQQTFIENYTKTEKEMFERLITSINVGDNTLQDTVKKADETFYKELVDDVTRPADGPSGPCVEPFSLPRYQMLVSMRDSKRHQQIEEWKRQRGKEFLQILTHIITDNAKILSNLDQEFKEYLLKFPGTS